MSRTTSAASQSTATSRATTASRNQCSSRPLLPVPRYQYSLGNHRNASVACQASSARQDGRASTASGTSHSEYCGLHTLLVTRKPTSSRNSSCGSRGLTRAPSASAATPTHTARMPMITTVLSTAGEPSGPTARSSGAPRMYCSRFHTESGSAGRVRFNVKNFNQASG